MRSCAILVFLVFNYACQKKFKWKEPKIDHQKVVTFEVVRIDSFEQTYLIEGITDDNHNIVLSSQKKNKAKCKKLIEVGNVYTMKLNFEIFATGDYDGYHLFWEEYPLKTAISMDNKKLNGLCFK